MNLVQEGVRIVAKSTTDTLNSDYSFLARAKSASTGGIVRTCLQTRECRVNESVAELDRLLDRARARASRANQPGETGCLWESDPFSELRDRPLGGGAHAGSAAPVGWPPLRRRWV